jgi:hypothetical protein
MVPKEAPPRDDEDEPRSRRRNRADEDERPRRRRDEDDDRNDDRPRRKPTGGKRAKPKCGVAYFLGLIEALVLAGGSAEAGKSGGGY